MQIKWNEVTWYSKLSALVFFLFVFPAWTFYLGNIYASYKYDIATSVEILQNKSNFDIDQETLDPKSYAGFSWEEEAPTLGKDALYMEHIAKESWQNVSITGRQWRTSPSEEYDLRNEELAGFTEMTYPARGWVKAVQIDNQLISSLNTIEEYKNIWGYMKINGNTLRVIIFSTSIDETRAYHPFGRLPSDRLQYQVFVSDPINIKSL